ncbi:MAG: TIGR00366 family protein, partial [Terriglobia bacterium]
SQWFVSFSTQLTFPFFSFLSAALINFFIPSGGGQWAVQGPIMLQAGQALGVSPTVTAMAVAFGDQTTNMLQPFWALPILAIAGLSIRHIMGYCLMTFLLSCALSTLVLFLWT